MCGSWSSPTGHQVGLVQQDIGGHEHGIGEQAEIVLVAGALFTHFFYLLDFFTPFGKRSSQLMGAMVDSNHMSSACWGIRDWRMRSDFAGLTPAAI